MDAEKCGSCKISMKNNPANIVYICKCYTAYCNINDCGRNIKIIFRDDYPNSDPDINDDYIDYDCYDDSYIDALKKYHCTKINKITKIKLTRCIKCDSNTKIIELKMKIKEYQDKLKYYKKELARLEKEKL